MPSSSFLFFSSDSSDLDRSRGSRRSFLSSELELLLLLPCSRSRHGRRLRLYILKRHPKNLKLLYIYIYIYMVTPPMNYRPSFCIVNTVSQQLFRQVRILYLSKTTENKLNFQENVSVNSFTFDVRSGSCISQGLLKSLSHFNRTCQSTHSLRFDVSTKSTAALYPPNPKPTLPRENQKKQKTKKTSFETLCGQTPKRCFFFVFPRKKMVLDRKT